MIFFRVLHRVDCPTRFDPFKVRPLPILQQNTNCYIYVDDILIYCKDEAGINDFIKRMR
jgi:hypothetical protein